MNVWAPATGLDAGIEASRATRTLDRVDGVEPGGDLDAGALHRLGEARS